jgi:hypothetical protein
MRSSFLTQLGAMGIIIIWDRVKKPRRDDNLGSLALKCRGTRRLVPHFLDRLRIAEARALNLRSRARPVFSARHKTWSLRGRKSLISFNGFS